MTLYNREGFRAYAQDRIADTIQTRFYPVQPFLYALTGRGGATTKSDVQIGSPGAAVVFAGTQISMAEKRTLGGLIRYQVPMQTGTNDSTKIMGARDTNPVVANATTQSQDQLYGTAGFSWVQMKTPIQIWNSSLDMAMKSGGGIDGRNLAIDRIIENATDMALQDLLKNLAYRLWNGMPSNQSATPWDDFIGIMGVVNDSNVYGGVDRSNPAAKNWRGKLVSSAVSADINTLLDFANYDTTVGQPLAAYGEGVNLILTSAPLYRTFRAQARSRGGIAIKEAIPEMQWLGYKKEVLQVDNAYVMFDLNCPANTVAMLNLDSWKVIIDPRHNFQVEPFEDVGRYVTGGQDAMQAFIDLQAMVVCEAPAGQALFTNVS